MERPNFFLRTKLLPPRPVSDLLSRPRLTRKLKDNSNSPMTLVTADAGCGKTTLVAEFIRQQPRQVVWYQLDYTDSDPFVFLGYICHGIKRFNPQFGETILPYLAQANDELLRVPERAVDLLLNEILETLDQPFILVLDDYHHIGRETVVHKLVDRLLQYASDTLHVIITTRDLPPLAMVRRRAQQSALIVTRDELLFTDDEMRELFKQTLNIELQPADVAEYREKTHGWVTALQLVRQVAEGHTSSESGVPHIDLKNLLRQSEKDIFDYFAEEVFAGENAETQFLLLHLSLLDALPLDLCSRLFPQMRASVILPSLVRRNVFVTVAGYGQGSEAFRFHPLFRDFLQRRLRMEIGRAGIAQELTRIAENFVETGNLEKALFYLIEAENYNQAAELIAERGADWIMSGAVTTLGLYTDKIPLSVLENYPRAIVNRAEVFRLQGETEQAVMLLNRAVNILREDGDAESEGEALHSLASIARRRGDCTAALNFLEQAEKLVGEISAVRMKSENTRGLCFVAAGAWTNAERQFRLALNLAEKLPDERFIRLITNNLALPYGLRGDFEEALRWLQRLFRPIQSAKSESQLPQDAIAHYNIAQLHLLRGELNQAEPHLERALELCQLYNLNAQRGEILEAYGNYYREKRDFPRSGEFYERARKAYLEAGIDLWVRELIEEQAKLALLKGDSAAAVLLLENLRRKREINGNETGLQLCRLALCRAQLAAAFNREIIEVLNEVLEYFHARSYYYYEAQAALLLAAAYFAANERPEILPHLRRALDIAARFDYEYWLRGEIQQNGLFFRDETVIELLPADLQAAIRNEAPPLTAAPPVDFVPAAVDEMVPAVIVDLTLNLLGQIEIYRDVTKPFASDAWTTRRARDIFCHIAVSRHRRIEKDVLIETFWGEADLNVIEKNFHPTISHIRKALNSKQAYKQNFLLYRDSAYQLNPQLSYEIDTEKFENLIAEAEAAKSGGDNEKFKSCLNAAHALYRGDYLSGVYEDWAEEKRGYFREQHLRVLTGLAKESFKEKNYPQTLKFTFQLLNDDPFREDVHRLIMRVYAAQGKRSALKEHFETMSRNLHNELGVAPASETKRIFHELFR